MSDLISRQAAIDAIEEYADRLQMVDWKENPGVPYKAYALNWCINTIRDLPSADRPQGWVDKAISIIDAMQKEGIIDYEQAWEFRMRARMKGADDE